MPAMSITAFDQILAGGTPCWRVNKDDHVLAFLDSARSPTA
jgi:hypothetical protein